MRVFDFNSAIVRLPGRSVVHGLSASPGPPPVFEQLLAEHGAYVQALRTAGVQVTVLEALEAFPDSVFVEDPALVFSETALLLRPGAPSRTRESEYLAPALTERFSRVLRLREGHADGGDVLVTPGCVYIGLSARTDDAGARSLQDLLASIGRRSRVVRTPTTTLHLKSDSTLIDEQTVLATAELAASGMFDRLRVLVAPEAELHSVNALRINDVVLCGAENPRTIELLAGNGLTVIPLPASEIGRIDARLSCMSLRWFDTALG